MKEVFDRIGIDGKNYGELHITEYQSSIAGLAGKLTELESLDELNYLSELLKMQFDDDREKFVAAMAYGDHTRDLQDIINLAQNLDCYWLYPSVQSEEDYGHYLIGELDALELPEEAKKYFMYEEYGRDAAINDGGRFTEQGYIYNNRNTFTEWYDGRDVPEEYRVTPQPPVQEKEQADLDASAVIQTAVTEQPPVLPIILSSEKPADKMKEITDRLEQGILGLYESDRYAVSYTHLDVYKRQIDTILNLVLFVPLGFFLPLLYKKYHHIKNVVLTGFLFSLSIEIIQMFGWGATDINDLIINTVGACLGYLIYYLLSKILPINFRKRLQSENVNDMVEIMLYAIYIFIVMITVQPWVVHSLLNIG